MAKASDGGETGLARFWRWVTVDFVEMTTGAILAALFFVFHAELLAAMTVIMAALVALGKQSLKAELRLIRQDLRRDLEPLFQLRRVIDIEQDANIEQIGEMTQSYLRITEDEIRAVKDGILMDAGEKLRRLSYQKSSGELATAEYYSWLLPMLDKVQSGERICAVSLMYDAEWDNSEVEVKFLQANLAAAARGVTVDRVFILDGGKLDAALQNEALRLHFQEATNGVNGYFIRREDLQARDHELLRRAGDGFIKLGERVALVDKFSSTGEVRGYVTMDQGELRNLTTVFNQLLVQATVISERVGTTKPQAALGASSTKLLERPKTSRPHGHGARTS